MKNKNSLSLTIAIPTCYGNESLVATAKSILASINVNILEFFIVADRTPIEPRIKKELKDMGVKLYWNDKEGSQFKKIKQMIDMAKGDIFIATQDDITFDRNTLQEIVATFENNKEITMLGTRVLPLPPVNFFESIMNVMLRLVDTVGRMWNNGENHLMASGRCLAFRTATLKKFRIPEKIINGDMYFYLENKRVGGKFAYTPNGIVFIRCPQNLKDQVGPSSRYQYSQEELKSYFSFDISQEYKIPIFVLAKAYLEELWKNRIQTFCYLGVFAYTRLKRQTKSIVSNPIWKIESSTKKVVK